MTEDNSLQEASQAENTDQDSTSIRLFNLDIVQKFLAFLVASSALLSAAGFLIVNGYLGRFTTIQGYSVVPGRFLAATFWLSVVALVFGCIGIIGYVTRRAFKVYYSVVIAAWLLMGVSSSFAFRLPDSSQDPETYALYGAFLLLNFVAFLLGAGAYVGQETRDFPHQSTFRRFTGLGAGLVGGTFYVILIIQTFSGAIYPMVSQSIGGGKPINAIIILYPEDAAALPLELAPGSRDTTKSLLILSELNNGYLVHDEDTNLTLIVKHESIRAIIDAGEPTYTPQPTPTLIPSATPTATP